jgi:hypothetical protein
MCKCILNRLNHRSEQCELLCILCTLCTGYVHRSHCITWGNVEHYWGREIKALRTIPSLGHALTDLWNYMNNKHEEKNPTESKDGKQARYRPQPVQQQKVNKNARVITSPQRRPLQAYAQAHHYPHPPAPHTPQTSHHPHPHDGAEASPHRHWHLVIRRFFVCVGCFFLGRVSYFRDNAMEVRRSSALSSGEP